MDREPFSVVIESVEIERTVRFTVTGAPDVDIWGSRPVRPDRGMLRQCRYPIGEDAHDGVDGTLSVSGLPVLKNGGVSRRADLRSFVHDPITEMKLLAACQREHDRCPACETRGEGFETKPDGPGYRQERFSCVNPSCDVTEFAARVVDHLNDGRTYRLARS